MSSQANAVATLAAALVVAVATAVMSRAEARRAKKEIEESRAEAEQKIEESRAEAERANKEKEESRAEAEQKIEESQAEAERAKKELEESRAEAERAKRKHEVRSACKGFFKPLARYFMEGFTFEDSRRFSLSMYVSSVQSEHEALMRTFCRDVLAPFIGQGRPRIETEFQAKADPSVRKMNLSGFAMSCAVKGGVYGNISDRADAVEADQEKYGVVDLSQNSLCTEEDMRCARRIAVATECRVLDLSYNRFLAGDPMMKEFKELLRVESLEHVIVEGNAIASIEAKEFYNSDDELVQKVVWMPRMWLETKGWNKVVDSPERANKIAAMHEAFYANWIRDR